MSQFLTFVGNQVTNVRFWGEGCPQWTISAFTIFLREKQKTRQQYTGLKSAMNTEYILSLTCCQDHILTENIWFVWSKTSYSDIVEISGYVSMRDKQTNSEDRATQPMEAGG